MVSPYSACTLLNNSLILKALLETLLCHSRPVLSDAPVWRTVITVTSISITVRSVCLEADRTVVSNRGHELLRVSIRYFLLNCCDPIFSFTLSWHTMSLLAKQNHCSMWSNWPTCSVMRVKFLKIAIFISAVALSASRSIIYGKKVASNWCELYAARVCAQSCQSLSVIDHHCFCVGVCPKLCVRMFKPLLPAMTACH